MNNLFFYTSAVAIGGALSGIINLAVVAMKKRNTLKTTELHISENHIQDCILPNNRGKSIDAIVKNLKKHGVDPVFFVDVS